MKTNSFVCAMWEPGLIGRVGCVVPGHILVDPVSGLICLVRDRDRS